TADWFRIGASPDFAPYLPHPEPFRAEDQAEALEPVTLDFAWKKSREEEEDDPDMIPLIDVSLVLLIFFMLTASSVVAAGFIDTPKTTFGLVASNPDALRIDIDLLGDQPVYSVGTGDQPAPKEDSNLTAVSEVMERV